LSGKNASDAEERRKLLSEELTTSALAKRTGQVVQERDPTRVTIAIARENFLDMKRKLVGPDQAARYEFATGIFVDGCKKTYLDELVVKDLVEVIFQLRKFPAYRNLRAKPSKRRNALQRRSRNPVDHGVIPPTTVSNYYSAIRHFLLNSGVSQSTFPPTPKSEEPVVTIYSPKQIEHLLSLLKGSLRIAISLMLKCGLRRKEVAYLAFSDINYDAKTIAVRGKTQYNFHVKNWSEREIPVPDDLIAELHEWDNAHPGQYLVVTDENGKPELRMIRKLKKFVFLHGLRCGRCGHCTSGNPECEDWELHKFRRTYATALVRHIDLRTAQRYLGHRRISSTERYLTAASASEGQQSVSAINWTKSFYS
jgi:integrase